MNILLVVVVCYLIGSVPTAYLAGRMKGINIFAVGSGNMGATNVARALGSRWGIAVMAIDCIKGVMAVLVGRLLHPADVNLASVAAALSVIVGHNWSLFATLLTGKIRGGKGAATTAGTWLIMFISWWHLVLVPLVVLMAVIRGTRYVSLGVLVGAFVAMVGALIAVATNTVPAIYTVYAVAFTAMIFYRHRENIDRLRQGKERRLGEKA
jgi:acyl phosphate:glycerol-3-phosphate acyltransferase